MLWRLWSWLRRCWNFWVHSRHEVVFVDNKDAFSKLRLFVIDVVERWRVEDDDNKNGHEEQAFMCAGAVTKKGAMWNGEVQVIAVSREIRSMTFETTAYATEEQATDAAIALGHELNRIVIATCTLAGARMNSMSTMQSCGDTKHGLN